MHPFQVIPPQVAHHPAVQEDGVAEVVVMVVVVVVVVVVGTGVVLGTGMHWLSYSLRTTHALPSC